MHAFVVVDPGDKGAVRGVEGDVGAGAVGAGLSDPGGDPDRAGREGAAVLAIAAEERRQRANPRPIDAPDDQHLEGTVEGQRVRQPCLAERPVDPGRRRRRGRRPGDDPRVAASFNLLQPLQVGTVEEYVAIQRGLAGGVREQRRQLECRLGLRMPVGEHDFSPRVHDLAAVACRPVQLDGHAVECASRTSLPARTRTGLGRSSWRITPLSKRKSSIPAKTSPGWRCIAPWASHSTISTIGKTGRPSMMCDLSTGRETRSISRSKTGTTDGLAVWVGAESSTPRSAEPWHAASGLLPKFPPSRGEPPRMTTSTGRSPAARISSMR